MKKHDDPSLIRRKEQMAQNNTKAEDGLSPEAIKKIHRWRDGNFTEEEIRTMEKNLGVREV